MGDVDAAWLARRTARQGFPPADATAMMESLRVAAHLGDRTTLRGYSSRDDGLNPRTDQGLQAIRAAEYDRAGTMYLLDIYTEAEWRAALQVIHKRHEKDDELIQIREGFYDLVRESLARVRSDNSKTVLAELHALREYTNEAFKSVQDAFTCIGTRINADWSLDSVKRNGTATSSTMLRGVIARTPAGGLDDAFDIDDDDDVEMIEFVDDDEL